MISFTAHASAPPTYINKILQALVGADVLDGALERYTLVAVGVVGIFAGVPGTALTEGGARLQTH